MGTDGFAGYWAAMTFALRFAEVDRSRMLDQVEAAFGLDTGIGRFARTVDVHHTVAAWETHLGRNGIVHRKGAVRANAGETVLIPPASKRGLDVPVRRAQDARRPRQDVDRA